MRGILFAALVIGTVRVGADEPPITIEPGIAPGNAPTPVRPDLAPRDIAFPPPAPGPRVDPEREPSIPRVRAFAINPGEPTDRQLVKEALNAYLELGRGHEAIERGGGFSPRGMNLAPHALTAAALLDDLAEHEPRAAYSVLRWMLYDQWNNERRTRLLINVGEVSPIELPQARFQRLVIQRKVERLHRRLGLDSEFGPTPIVPDDLEPAPLPPAPEPAPAPPN